MHGALLVGLCEFCACAMYAVCIMYVFRMYLLVDFGLVRLAVTQLIDAGQVACWSVRALRVFYAFCVLCMRSVHVFGATPSGTPSGNRAH